MYLSSRIGVADLMSHKILAVLIGTMMVCGCISHTTFQSPKVLDPGQVNVGLGAMGWMQRNDSDRHQGFLEVDLYGRIGLTRNLDAGIKLFGPFGGIFGDAKYQLWQRPPFLSADLGFSYGRFGDMPDSGDDFYYFGFYPMLLIGYEDLYGGVKLIYVEETRHRSYGPGGTETERYSRPGIVLGATVGARVKMRPEVNIYKIDQGLLYTGGLAVEWVSKPPVD